MSATAEHPNATVPGGMEHVLSRRIPKGLIEFEQAPAGWLTKDGNVRRSDWRAYFWTPTGGKRTRLPSVTTLLDDILPKGGLPRWAEEHGIRGAVAAGRAGLIDENTPLEEVAGIVRKAHLGADAAKDDAADRGLNVHELNQIYMETGEAPRLAGHPPAHHGFIRGLTNFLLDYDPEPVAVEQLVCDADAGYAGRLDLRARIPRMCSGLTTLDVKTQANAAIHPGAHWQVNMYERGARWCGDEPADRLLVVVVAENGEYRVMPADHPLHIVDAALLFRRMLTPIKGACETANSRERDARRPVAA